MDEEAVAEAPAVMVGWLEKHSPNKALVKRWQTRHFRLTHTTLTYRKRPDTPVLGSIRLARVEAVRLDATAGTKRKQQRRVTFELVTEGRVYVLAADSESTAKQWTDAILRTRAQAPTASFSFASDAAPLAPVSCRSAHALHQPLRGLEPQPPPISTPTIASASIQPKADTQKLPDEGSPIAGELLLFASGAGGEDVLYTHHSLRDCREAKLWFTNYRLIFMTKEKNESLPLGLVMKMKTTRHDERGLPGFALTCKDFRCLSFFLVQSDHHKALVTLLKQHACPEHIYDVFAFKNQERFAATANAAGFYLYDVRMEFERLQIPARHWRITHLNADFRISSFPNQFIVPEAISDDEIDALWRSQQKWQRWTLALCWRHPMSEACLLRACKERRPSDEASAKGPRLISFDSESRSPKLSSARGQRSMMQHVLMLHRQAGSVLVVDTSPPRKRLRTSQAKQDESEDDQVERIETVEGQIQKRAVKLMSPEAVGESLARLVRLVSSFDKHLFTAKPERAREWRRAVYSAGWLSGIGQLFAVTDSVVTRLQLGNPVVVLNQRGGESVPQVVSLAQICLDAHCRTVEGFCALLEKEWMAFGFEWGQSRQAKYQATQQSFLFLQFIDAVWQLWVQWPSQFEFGPSLLMFLLDSLYTCRFGSFLADSHQDRTRGGLGDTVSVWAYIFAHKSDFLNSAYDAKARVTKLAVHPAQVTLWTEYYLRWVAGASATHELVRAEADALNLGNLSLCAVPDSVLLGLPPRGSLSLANNFLASVSTSLHHLTSVRALDLSHNLIATFAQQRDFASSSRQPAEHGGGAWPNLTELNLGYNRLWCLEQLPVTLTSLNVAHNVIERLPKHISSLTNLRVLNLSHNKFAIIQGQRAIHEGILRLPSLTNLKLAGNGLAALPADFFSSLPGLEVLDVAHNALSALPAGIASCSRLRVLTLSANVLTALPDDMADLCHLEELRARNCLAARTGEAPDKDHRLAPLVRLTQLRHLDLRNNYLLSLPAGCFAEWSCMNTLLLSHNQLASLPPDVGRMARSLEELDLTHNQLDALPTELAKLTRLRVLAVEENAIVELPAQLGSLTQLERLAVGTQSRRLRSPPGEVVALGSESIVTYLGQLLKGQEPCYRMKLMFVGHENVGKTSLLRALQRDGQPIAKSGSTGSLRVAPASQISPQQAAPVSTDGIDISGWTLPMGSVWSNRAAAVELSAWDFAGQEIYYATHQFFLSERSLFLVVFNALSPVHSRIEYWLQSVKTAVKGSPVLLVGTHAESEECTEEFLGRLKTELLQKFRFKYPNMAGVHFVSAVSGKNIDQLLGGIRDIIAKQDFMGRPLPSSYLALEKALAMHAKSRTPPVLSWQAYSNLARLSLIYDERDLRTATAFLHNLGSLVHFDKDEKLQDVVILDPQWLMDMLSTVVSTKHNFCRNGVIAHSSLPHIWKAPTYPPELHGFLMSLLERFEVTFPVQEHVHKLGLMDEDEEGEGGSVAVADRQSSLVPALLPEERPARLTHLWPSFIRAEEHVFGRTYRFDFVPRGFMGRLIIRLLGFPLAAQVLWRHGMLARFANEQMLVELQPEANQLSLLVRTGLRGEEMSSLCWLIFAAVESLVKEWYNLEARVEVPCPHCLGRGGLNVAPHMFTFEECQTAAITPNDSFLYCRIGGLKDSEATPIRLDAAAPDLAMAHLDGHKIAFGELEKHEPAIGEGGYATVFRGTYRGEVVAIKQLKSGADDAIDPWSMPGGGDGQADAQRRTYEEFRHEVWIMSGLAHPNLVALRGFCTEPACIVTEFVGAGTLLEFLADRAKPLDWPLRLKIAKDVAKGCAFLHSTSPPVMHRDLKSPNILLADLSPDAEVVAKVCDFGVSLSAAHHTAGRRVDCPIWLAPEVLANKIYTEKADVYSLGVILWELLTRDSFFGELAFMQQIEDKVLAGERPPIPQHCVPAYRQLIQDCWAQDPERRPPCSEVVARLAEIMRKVCPEASNYDALAKTRYHANEAKRRAAMASTAPAARSMTPNSTSPSPRTFESLPTTAQTHRRRELDASNSSSKTILTQSIRDMAMSDRCSKTDIILCMERFLQQRRHALEEEEEEEIHDGDDEADEKGKRRIDVSNDEQLSKKKKKQSEQRKWIEHYMQALQQERRKEVSGDGHEGEEWSEANLRDQTDEPNEVMQNGASKKNSKDQETDAEAEREANDGGLAGWSAGSEEAETQVQGLHGTESDYELAFSSLEAASHVAVSPESARRRLLGGGAPLAARLEAHQGEVNVLCALPNGMLASGTDNASILVWDPRRPKVRPETIKTRSKSVWSLQVVMRKGVLCLASGSWDGAIHLYAVKTGKHQASFHGHKDAVFRLAVLPDGVLVSASWDSSIRLWDPDTGTCIATLADHQGKVRALGILPDGRIVSGGDDQIIRVWAGDASRGHMRCTGRLGGHDKPVECIAVLLDGRLVSGSQDMMLRVWDVDKEVCVRVLEGHQGTVRTLQALPEGFLASGSADKSIRLWHVHSGALVHTIHDAHAKDVVCLALAATGRLTSGGWDKVIKLWNFPVRA